MNTAKQVVAVLLDSDPAHALAEVDKWDRFGKSFGELEQKAEASTAKFGELRRSVQNWLPKQGGENAQQVMAQMGELEGKYAQRDKLLAKIRHAAAYRRACAKAGVNPADVAQRFSSKVEKFGRPMRVQMTELELKDGRRVKIEPFDIPNELITRS